MKMTKNDLNTFLDAALKDSVREDSTYIDENADLLSYYLGEPLGDEEDGRSQVVSPDVQDLVEADMPSLARIFLGSGDILEFAPNTANPDDIREAEEKTRYINHLVRKQRDSFKTILDWLKAAEINKTGIVKFYVDEKKSTDEREYKGLSQDELVLLMSDLQATPGVELVEPIEQEEEDGMYHVTFRITKKVKRYTIAGVPVENFHISKDATCKDDAMVVGDVAYKTRGQLIAEGYDKETVKKLTRMTRDEDGRLIADKRIVGNQEIIGSSPNWASEMVEIETLYPLVDYDGDGIPERRHIVRSGRYILENKPFGIVPYAIFSTITMPHVAIGRSRAEVAKPTQYVKTHLTRQILDNIYSVNRPRIAVNDSAQGGVELDDMLIHRLDGVVRVDGPVVGNIVPIETPYIGDKALMVVQYVDSMRAQTTGSLMASQGLNVDALHKETATRFEGVNDQSQAKIELVARVLAETGFRDLYEGMAWLVQHYQDEAAEIAVLGQPMTIDPRKWKYEHYCTSTVGLAAGDTAEMMQNIAGLFASQQALMASGSPLVDSKKIYNTGSKMIKLMGLHNVADYLNDPEQPQEVLMATVEQLSIQLQQLQAQMKDPAIIKAQAQAEVDRARAEGQLALEQARGENDMTKFMLEQAAKQDQFNKDMLFKLTELDMKLNTAQQNDIPGTLED